MLKEKTHIKRFNVISQGVIYDKDDENEMKEYQDLAKFEKGAMEKYIQEAGAYPSIIYLIFKLFFSVNLKS